jgi:3',5'-cyclic AMP phosphodiesterase CpdA
MTLRQLAAVAVLGSSVFLGQCGGNSPSAPTSVPTPVGGGGTTPPGPATAHILAAGDIGECGFGAAKTGQLLDSLGGTVLALGDLAYMQGTMANFRDCFDPAWGRHADRTRPVPGNHEYVTAGASSFFDYFGDTAGPRGLGYYAFNAGPWRIIALNSELPKTPGTAQNQWLRSELENNRTTCTLAYFHRPLFSSGPNGNQPDMRDLWRVLDEFGVDVVLAGHDHMYERFAPQDIDGRARADGIRQFIAGTGGAHLYIPGPPKPNSDVRAGVYGILQMTLSATSYQWDFVSVDNTFRDTGSGACH